MTENQAYCGLQRQLQTKNGNLPRIEHTPYLSYCMVNKHVSSLLFLFLWWITIKPRKEINNFHEIWYINLGFKSQILEHFFWSKVPLAAHDPCSILQILHNTEYILVDIDCTVLSMNGVQSLSSALFTLHNFSIFSLHCPLSSLRIFSKHGNLFIGYR